MHKYMYIYIYYGAILQFRGDVDTSQVVVQDFCIYSIN